MTQDTLKILVVGDVKGNYGKLFTRVKNVNEKNGPFEMLLCVGEFFGSSEEDWEPYKSGQKTVPVPTYILGPCQSQTTVFYPDLKGCELAPNITYLGDRGMYTGGNGLKIAYLSGKEGQKSDVTTFSHDAIKAIQIQAMNEPIFKGIDILITSQWPKDVCKFTTAPDGIDVEKCGSSLISSLAKTLKPRYHFAGMENLFFQRPAYRNHRVLQESATHVSWFVSMGEVGNAKQKWIFAFNITPLKKEVPAKLCVQPAGVTDCPYTASSTSAEEARQEAFQNQFFYDTKSQNTQQDNSRKRKHNDQGQAPRPPPKPMGPCWFCLSSPEVEKHLVISVGDQCYLALAKGHLTPDHVLILPIGHYQKTVGLPEEVLDEINKFKQALRDCFKAKGKGVVFFERNYKSPHLQIQAIPVPLSKLDIDRQSGLHFDEIFLEGSRAVGVNLQKLPKDSDVQEIVKPNAPYFYMELPGGQQLLSYVQRGVQFPLEFGREIMASKKVLNLPDRVHWRECKVPKEEELKLVEKFREIFKPFDFTD